MFALSVVLPSFRQILGCPGSDVFWPLPTRSEHPCESVPGQSSSVACALGAYSIFTVHRLATEALCSRIYLMTKSLQVGKYLISPLIRRNHDGRYLASVSIRSGRSSMTHDRLMRFDNCFNSARDAERFAKTQAISYIKTREAPSIQFS